MAQLGRNSLELHGIATLVAENIGLIEAFATALALDEVRYSKIIYQLERFKLWAGSIGAHRKSGLRSLDQRLRDSTAVREHILTLLKQLGEYIEDASSTPSDLTESTCEALDSLDLELIEYFKDDNNSGKFDLDGALDGVRHVIDCLLRLSVVIRNPAPHDQFTSRAKEETPAYYGRLEEYDSKHVQEKFPHMEPELAKRLGRSITSRRHFFQYREEHYARISNGIDDASGSEEDGDQTTVASSVPEQYQGATSEGVLIDSDVRSVTSETSYAPSSRSGNGLRAPPMPKGYLDGPVLCPFCYLMIEVHTRSDWKKHIFRDLQPYICLAPSCLTQDYKFSRRSDWAYHMKQVHWRVWRCTCEYERAFDSADEFRCHLRKVHDDLNLQQQDTLETIYSQNAFDKALGPCPLCIDEVNISSVTHYSTHVGEHLEQLALFALPQRTDDGDENESRKHSTEEQGDHQIAPVASDSSDGHQAEDGKSGDQGGNVSTGVTKRTVIYPGKPYSGKPSSAKPSSGKPSSGKPYSGNSSYSYASQPLSESGKGEQSKWRWNCCGCGFQNNSYNYNTTCATCGHHRDHNCQIWGQS
ncbi:hypothetical protein GGR51DRAFT_532333 [Nemania sp. FL0031]|nr:hypothetical protein GGR51DRAFT_532333 [Nemania sp. FL0031]